MSEITLNKVVAKVSETLRIETNSKGDGSKRGEKKTVTILKIDERGGNTNFIVTTDGSDRQNLGGGTKVIK